jgi:hypothetical protein
VFSIGLRTSGSGVSHIIRAASQWPLNSHITSVTGVPFEGQLPGAEVRVSGDSASIGAIEVRVSSGALFPLDWLLEPPLIEVTAENEHLLQTFRTGRVTRW